MASIFPLADLVAAVGGPGVAVTPLLPAGASPHTFEVSPADVRLLASAELVVAIGGDLDPFVRQLTSAASTSATRLELLPTVPQAALIAATGGSGQEPFAELPDPHIWLDPIIVRDNLLPAITDVLSVLRPGLATGFREREKAYAAELTALDAWIRDRLQGLGSKGIITMHRAWAYFGARYGMPTWAVANQPGQEPSPRRLIDLLALATEREIRALFTEPQLAIQAVETLVGEIGGQVLTLDPLGGSEQAGYSSYVEMMRTNVLTIERGLR